MLIGQNSTAIRFCNLSLLWRRMRIKGRCPKKNGKTWEFSHMGGQPLYYTPGCWKSTIWSFGFQTLHCGARWCGGDEFECKYPAFTGISREIRCDLGEGDKARGGGVGGWGSVSIILTFLENFQNTRGLLVYPIYSATKYCVNISWKHNLFFSVGQFLLSKNVLLTNWSQSPPLSVL